MSVDKNKSQEDALMTIKAIHLTTNEIIAKGTNGEEVIKKANESGEEYILDFVTPEGSSYIF